MPDKSTQGPWRTRRNNGEAPNDMIVMDEAGVSICDCFPDSPNTTIAEAEANAALIVRAVNHHEELVDALKEIAEGKGPFNRNPLLHAENVIEEAKATANAVLAKVEAGDA